MAMVDLGLMPLRSGLSGHGTPMLHPVPTTRVLDLIPDHPSGLDRGRDDHSGTVVNPDLSWSPGLASFKPQRKMQ